MNTAQPPANAPAAPWFSDVPADRKRSTVTLAILASLVLHLVIIALIALALGILPKKLTTPPTARPQVEEIELTVIPPKPKEEPVAVLPLQPDPQRNILDSRGLAVAEEAAKEARFESDQNMKAASERPATGNVPLPSQDGIKLPGPEFTTQEMKLDTLGSDPEPQPLTALSPDAPPAALYKPKPIPAANLDPKTQEPARNLPLPELATKTPPLSDEAAETNALAQRALEMVRKVMHPDEDEIPLTTKPMVMPPPVLTEEKPVPDLTSERPRPAPLKLPKPVATPRPQEMAMNATPVPRASGAGAQLERRKTRIEGNISNRGKASVDAERTPMAVYLLRANQGIATRWQHYLRNRADLVELGSVVVSFSINEKGKVFGIRIESKNPNRSLADVCERAIRETEIEPPPEDLFTAMKDNCIETTITFTYYSL